MGINKSEDKKLKAWKIKLHKSELRMMMAEINRLENEAKCYRLARDIYKELIKLDQLLKEKERMGT